MVSVVPEVPLTATKTCPVLGLGTFTFQDRTGSKEVLTEAVKFAVSIGYRHFDCAQVYGNEEAVGDGIRAKIEDGTVRREDIFLTTKLWNTSHNVKHIKASVEKSLKKLQCDYLDLLLMHYPVAFKQYINAPEVPTPPRHLIRLLNSSGKQELGSYQDGDKLFPADESGKMIFADHDYIDTWRGMEELVDLGVVKVIGISNFNIGQVTRLLQNCRIKPAVHQVEVHPYFSNHKLLDFCSQHGIMVTAFSPFGNPGRPEKEQGEPNILTDPVLKDIADKKNKSVAQICLRFLYQRNLMLIPKSVSPQRIKENIEVFDFELNQDEMKTIFSLDRGLRFLKEEISIGHKYYPFTDDE